MKAQHTPGPWRAEFGERAQGTSGALVRDRIGIVAEAYPRNPSGTEQTSNARLIAAAPDMLAALETLNRRLAGGVQNSWAKSLQDIVAPAIAKATGGA